jgi:hypothetical protein
MKKLRTASVIAFGTMLMGVLAGTGHAESIKSNFHAGWMQKNGNTRRRRSGKSCYRT